MRRYQAIFAILKKQLQLLFYIAIDKKNYSKRGANRV